MGPDFNFNGLELFRALAISAVDDPFDRLGLLLLRNGRILRRGRLGPSQPLKRLVARTRERAAVSAAMRCFIFLNLPDADYRNLRSHRQWPWRSSFGTSCY